MLEDPFAYEYSDWLYMASNSETNLDAEAMMLPTDDLLPEELHPEAVKKGFIEILDIAAVQDVVESLQDQDGDTGIERRHEAFLHYRKYDSFLDLGG